MCYANCSVTSSKFFVAGTHTCLSACPQKYAYYGKQKQYTAKCPNAYYKSYGKYECKEITNSFSFNKTALVLSETISYAHKTQ